MYPYRKVKDCVTLEIACKKKKVRAAAKVKVAQAKIDRTRNNLRVLEKELKILAETASKKRCKAEDRVDCKEWKKRVTSAAKRVATQTAVVIGNQERLALTNTALKSAKRKNCDLKCKEGKSACRIEVYRYLWSREIFWN